jgi:hypothetical protein
MNEISKDMEISIDMEISEPRFVAMQRESVTDKRQNWQNLRRCVP